MKDDTLPTTVLAAYTVAGVLIGWAMLKAMVIGYYPDEMVPLVLVPIALGLAAIGVGKKLHDRADVEAATKTAPDPETGATS